MAINFPDPSASPWYNDPASGGNGVTYVYTSGGYWTAVQVTGSNAIDQTTGDARYVNVSGDSMTGHLNVAGTVSVGTTASAAVLQFPAATGWGPRIQQGGASINDFGVFTNNTEALTVKSNGNVGIGTTSPGANLEIKATSVPVIRLNQADTYYAPIKLAGNDLEIRGSSGTIEFYNGANDGDSSTEKMCIDSSGNVGIGTSSPSDILHLNSSTGYGLKITDASSHIATYRTHGDGAILKTASNHALLFGTNDTERMRIDSSGNVGIGKSSNLFYRLTFQEGSGDASRIGWVSTSGNRKASIDCGNTAAIVFNTGTGDDERMRIDSSGFVLIGTTVSSSLSDRLLTVGQGSRAASYLEIRSSSTGDGGLLFSDGTSGNAGYRGQVVYSHSIDALQFWTAATERMRINSSGEFRHTPGGATSSTYMKSNVENTNEYVFKVFRDGAHSTAITFQTQISGAGAERMRIDSSGRLLVGSSSDVSGGTTSTALQVATSGGGYLGLAKNDTSVVTGNGIGGLRFYANDPSAFNIVAELSCAADGTHALNDYPTRLEFLTTADGASSPTERMRIGSNGTIRTLMTGTTARFHLSTTESASGSTILLNCVHSRTAVDTGGTSSLRIYSNGNVENANNSYGALSDVKLKENIVDAPSQWNDFKAVRFRKFNFKEETGHETHTQLGVIAQELELISPGLVYEIPDADDDGNDLGTTTKAVKSTVLTKKALVALQEAMERIEVLEQRLTDAGIA